MPFDDNKTGYIRGGFPHDYFMLRTDCFQELGWLNQRQVSTILFHLPTIAKFSTTAQCHHQKQGVVRAATLRRDFLSEDFILEHCGICMELFDADHEPIDERYKRRYMRSADCLHKFGHDCLYKLRADSDPAYGKPECPLCKQLPCLKPNKLQFAKGVRPVSIDDFQSAHHFDTWLQAKSFVKLMWKMMHNFYKGGYIIYDSDIEDQVTFCLTSIADLHNPYRIPIVFSEYWPGVREVARVMLGEHHKNGCFVPLTKNEVKSYTYHPGGSF